MDNHNIFNRPTSNKEYKSLSKGLVKHEKRQNAAGVAQAAALTGVSAYYGLGKSYREQIHQKIKDSEKAISMRRTDLHKPLKDVINMYRQKSDYPRGRGQVVEVQHVNTGLKALTGKKGAPFVGGGAYKITDKSKKPIDFPEFMRGVKNVRKEVETKKLKPMKIHLSNYKDQARSIPNIIAMANDEANRRVAKKFGLPLGVIATGALGYHAYKYNKAANKKLKESDTSIWRGGTYHYKNKKGTTYAVHQQNPVLRGGFKAGLMAGVGYGSKHLLKNFLKEKPAYTPHLEPIMKHLTHKKIGAAAAGVGALGMGAALLRNRMDKKYMPAYLKGTKQITKQEYKNSNPHALIPIAIKTPGSHIFEKRKDLLSGTEDKYPWSYNKVVRSKKIKEAALLEMSPEHVINTVMNSKKKFNPRAIARATRILHQMSLNAVKKKGIKAGIQNNIDAAVHTTRHPKVKAVVDTINMTEPHFQGLPLHPGRW